MLPDNRKQRLIREETRFSLELAKLTTDRKADEFIDAAKWVLSRDPRKGRQIGTSHVWFLPMDEIPGGNLPVILYYSFSEERVYFLSIEETLYPPRE